MSKKVLYMMFLFILILGYVAVRPTFANFSSDYVTENDAFGLNLHFDLSVDHFEEYEEIRVMSNSYEIFNVNIENSTLDTIYYGIWYKIPSSFMDKDSIMIGRLEDNLTGVSGELASLEEKTVSVIIKNNSSNDVTVMIGVGSSSSGVSDIEYVNGKQFINNSYKEVDYRYDDGLKRYVSSLDNNLSFGLGSSTFSVDNGVQPFVVNHAGAYLIEAWGASNGNYKGDYVSGVISLEDKEKLYISVGKKNGLEHNSSISLTDGDGEDVSSKIMIASNHLENDYISGHFGHLSSYFTDDDLKSKCVTGGEDIRCSYHYSGKIFYHTNIISSDKEMDSFDGKNKMIGNDGDGFVKITPVVPMIEIPSLKVLVGNSLDISGVVCKGGLHGCHIVRVVPEDTSQYAVGNHSISFMVSDDSGFVYQYTGQFEVVEK